VGNCKRPEIIENQKALGPLRKMGLFLVGLWSRPPTIDYNVWPLPDFGEKAAQHVHLSKLNREQQAYHNR
jgi:hypothetical protein